MFELSNISIVMFLFQIFETILIVNISRSRAMMILLFLLMLDSLFVDDVLMPLMVIFVMGVILTYLGYTRRSKLQLIFGLATCTSLASILLYETYLIAEEVS
ncbi:hypothetical protein [Companilactobacillus jidongensis]|uniref:hypothetical protein n=1 Tax=Companilactobacillus jidongensis TaxID=2486006 RepID=UPI000F76CC0B|nr:hypothetical protein [Companilactobacillus jidongensis]